MLSEDNRRDIIKFRIEKAHNVFEEAKEVASLKRWNLAGNRLYYTIYHIGSALFFSKGISAKSHSGVIHQLGETFIKTDILPKEYGKLIARLFALRQSGDYDDMFYATEEIVMPLFDKVEKLLTDLEQLIEV